MAMVFSAVDEKLDRNVAVKVLPKEYTFNNEFVVRFMDEAKIAAGIEHNNIIKIYEVGQEQGFCFIVMSLVEGETLAERMARSKLSLDEAIGITKKIVQALDEIHHKSFVHRDIKPSNIIIRRQDNEPILMDFGIAYTERSTRLTQAGATVGTPEYISPEQIRGEQVGPASDFYSLGIMFYQMLAGRAPFEGTITHLLHAHVFTPPPPLTDFTDAVPPGLQGVVRKMLAKRPEHRFRNAAELMAAIEAPDRWSGFSDPGLTQNAASPDQTVVMGGQQPAPVPPGMPAQAGVPPAGTPASTQAQQDPQSGVRSALVIILLMIIALGVLIVVYMAMSSGSRYRESGTISEVRKNGSSDNQESSGEQDKPLPPPSIGVIKTFIQEWKNAENSEDLQTYMRFYDDPVHYYQHGTLSHSQLRNKIQNIFNRIDYNYRTTGWDNIQITDYNDEYVSFSFTEHSRIENHSTGGVRTKTSTVVLRARRYGQDTFKISSEDRR